MENLTKRLHFGGGWAAMGRSLGRFPLPMACGLLFAAAYIGEEHGVGWLEKNKVDDQIMAFGFLGFFLTLAITLFAEGRGWSRLRQFAMAAVALPLLGLRVYVQPNDNDVFFGGLHLFLGPSFVLLAMSAPFFKHDANDAAFWQFNRTAWLSAAFGLLVALVVGFGLMAGYRAVEMLFGLNLSSRLYGDSWVLCFAVLWPWQALAGLPGRFDAPEDEACPRWVRYLAGYFLVPFVTAYLIIICVYIVKILIDWDLPKGQVAYVVAGYVGFGVATYLVAYPLRETGNRLTRLFQRYFLRGLFVPAALMAVAIGQRIAQYGVTESRYALVAFAVWLAILAAYFVVSRQRRLIFIPVSAAMLLAIGSTGPWGAQSVSVHSQLSRLEGLLQRHGLLVDGRVVLAGKKRSEQIPKADLKSISGAVRYLVSREASARLRPWFEGLAFDFEQETLTAYKVVAAMKLEYLDRWQDTEYFTFSATHDTDLDIAGYRTFSRFQLNGSVKRRLGAARSGRSYLVAYDRGDGVMTVTDGAGVVLRFDLKALVERLRAVKKSGGHRKMMILTAADGKFGARLHVNRIRGSGDIIHWSEVLLFIR